MAEHPPLDQQVPRAANAWLGPAPGPVATTAASPARVSPAPVGREAPLPPRPRPAIGELVRVTVGKIEEVDGMVRLAQSFVLEHSRDAVWQLMSEPQSVARAMPGAHLDGPPQDGRITGRLEVKLGPITASFAGEGTVEPFPAEFRQIIRGRGGDRTSGSRVTGSVDYRLFAISPEIPAPLRRASTSSSATPSPACWPSSAVPTWHAISRSASARPSPRTLTHSCETRPARPCGKPKSAPYRCSCRSLRRAHAPSSPGSWVGSRGMARAASAAVECHRILTKRGHYSNSAFDCAPLGRQHFSVKGCCRTCRDLAGNRGCDEGPCHRGVEPYCCRFLSP